MSANTVDNIEILKTLQTTLSFLVKQQEEAKEKEQGYKIVETYKRNKAELITCKEASKKYPFSETKFRELCRSKNKGFPSLKINSRYYIVEDMLSDWIRDNIGAEI